MSAQLPQADQFSFVRRPVPVPGDLRIAWRLSLILLMLGASRGNRASLAKLYVLNDALKSASARVRLRNIIQFIEPPSSWRVRVEPALGRAIDFVVGEKLATWAEVSQRAGLQLTPAGLKAVDHLRKAEDALRDEKGFLEDLARPVTEGFVSALLSTRNRL
jgi:hypothetical protein